MKKVFKILSLILAFSLPLATAEAGIFSSTDNKYPSVQAKTQELHDKFSAYQCPNLSGAELSKCLEVRSGYSFSYGSSANDDMFMFTYETKNENVFGQESRQVEHVSYAFLIENYKLVIFTLERVATGYSETFTISEPVLRVYLDRVSNDGEMSILHEEIELTVPGQGWVNHTLRGRPQAPHEKPRLHSSEANDGIWELHKAANRAFWD